MDNGTAQTDINDATRAPHTRDGGLQGSTEQIADYFGLYVKGALTAEGLPLRIYADTYSEGLVRQFPLERYTQLNKNVYKNFVTGLSQQTFVITQNKYVTHQDDHILDAILENVSKLTERELLSLLRALAFQAEAQLIDAGSSHRNIIDELLETSKYSLSHNLIVPFVLPFEGTDITTDKNAKQLLITMHEATVSRLYDASRELLRNIYTTYFASTSYVSKDSLMVVLADAFTPKLVKDSLRRCVEDFRVNDAYQQVYALHRSTMIGTKANLYAYFGELKYGKRAFPLFFTEVVSEHKFPSVTLTFKNRIHVNKQAIEYVVRHFAAHANQHIDIQSLNIPSVVSAADSTQVMQELTAQLSDILKLDPLELNKAAFQENGNYPVVMTNRLHFYVDAPSLAAVADDYTKITSNSKLRAEVESYLDTLLTKLPAQFNETISEEWDEKSYLDKLMPAIPYSVNDEQKQVLSALENTAAHRIVVDSANATGKKHLVKASIISALTRGQSVLVVTDSAESAGRLHEGIGEILQQSSGRVGHNPVLNLHDTETFDRIDEQVMADTLRGIRTVEDRHEELRAAKKRKKRALKDGLAHFMQNAENINLHEIRQTVLNDRRFAGKSWIEDESIETIGTDIQKLHRSIQYVRSSEAGYLMPYIEVDQQKAIGTFISTFKEYEHASKDVYSRLPEFITQYRRLAPEQEKHLRDNLAYIQSNHRQFMKIIKEHSASNWMTIADGSTFRDIAEQEAVLEHVLAIARGADEIFGDSDKTLLLHELDSYTITPADIIDTFDTYIEQISTLKSKLFGFSGRMLVVENLNKQLAKSLPQFRLPEPEKQSDNMQVMSDFMKYVTEELQDAGLADHYWKNIVQILLADPSEVTESEQIVASLNQLARYEFVLSFKVQEADNLLANITLLQYATQLNKLYKEFPELGRLAGVTTMSQLLARPHEFAAKISKLSHDLNEAGRLGEAKQTIKAFVETYPAASKRLSVSYDDGILVVKDDSFAASESEYIKEYVAHKKQEQDIRTYFEGVVRDSFSADTTEYQQIMGVELQYELNKRLAQAVDGASFQDGSFSGALKEQRQLVAKDVAELTKVYPVVVGEMHLISSMLPMVVGLFDLVVIDAADSMTIAATLPAAVRGKKLLAVGDSALTNTTAPIYAPTNDLYIKRISAMLKQNLTSKSTSDKNAIIARYESSLIASQSALQFFSTYANYYYSFKKQFGFYEELVAFGNKYYYGNNPVSLTPRIAPLSDIFQFTRTKAKSGQASRFTNKAEVESIIQHLHKLKEQDFTGTIAIVTPFAEQAALIQKELDECVITDWFERRQLKVMTFATKRHTVSDYTYYSLVASYDFNELAQKLPSSLKHEALSHDSRSHQLLSGMSGTRHRIHIVHSLDVRAYGGAVSEMLQFLSEKSRADSPMTAKGAATDILLDVEANIAQVFDKTSFAKKYGARAAFIVKYPFADFIKPLSPRYSKASFKVFFLVAVEDKPIIVEFDDLKDRLLKNDSETNGAYLSDDDIYAYKLLEGYGYRFLRLNKFTVGSDPVRTLDMHLNELLKTPSWPSDNGFTA